VIWVVRERYTIFFVGRDHLGGLCQDGRIILKLFTEKYGCRFLEWIQLCKENGEKPVGSIKHIHYSSV
jgi:hypothetical protein